MNPALRALLGNRNFVLLWCAYAISAMGDHLSEMAILATQNALDPGIDVTPLQARMTLVFMLPFLLLGSMTGALADRVPRRWLMILADLMRAAIMLWFFVLIHYFSDALGDTWGPFVPLGLVGVFAALFSPARAAMVPMLVGRNELSAANAMIGGLGMIATMFASIISGELAQRGMAKTAFNLDAGTFVLSAFCVFLISRKWGPITEHVHQVSDSFWASIVDGVRYIAGHRRVAQLIGIAVVFWFAGATVRSVIPAIVKNVYQGGYPEMARFPVWIGLGLATGALIISVLGSALRSEIAITWCLFGTGLGICGMAASVFIGFDPGVAHVFGGMSIFVAGVFGAGIAASYNAMLQRFVPNRYRGRVYGVLNVATVGGLLVATGVLAIPQWENLDRWAGFMLAIVAALLIGVAGVTYAVRQPNLPLDKLYGFIRNAVEVLIRFWYRCRRVGHCTIPRSGPVIVTANHVCPIDPFLIIGWCPYRHLEFMVAAEYTNIPVVRFFLRHGRCIPVRRGKHDIAAIKTALRRLRNDKVIGLFIQGGIRDKQSEHELKNGVAMLALRTGAKVIPVHISGLREHRSMLGSFLKRHDARVAFGPAVDLAEFAGGKGHENLQAATRKIFAAINALAPK